MDILKNVQTIVKILSEHKIQIAIILALLCFLNIFFNIIVLSNGTNNIPNKNNKKD